MAEENITTKENQSSKATTEESTASKENQSVKSTPKEKNTGMAAVAYILFFIPLLTDAKDDAFVKYHVKQGLVLFIVEIIVWIIGSILPWGLHVITQLLNLGVFILIILGIMNAIQGEKKPLPLIGQFGDQFKI